MGKNRKQEEFVMQAFLASFAGYVIQLIALVIVAAVGMMTGKKLRENKDEKAAQRPRINR